MLRDRGDLNDGQILIVDDLISPKIAELKGLFSGVSLSTEQVVADRKRSLISLSGLVDSAKALAFTATAIGNADRAGANVVKAPYTLAPVLDMLKDPVS